MNDTGMITVTRQHDGTAVEVLDDGSTRPYEGRTDWARVDAMTEDEVEANALADPDNPPSPRPNLTGCVRSPIQNSFGIGCT